MLAPSNAAFAKTKAASMATTAKLYRMDDVPDKDSAMKIVPQY